jgi:hypothetical protein
MRVVMAAAALSLMLGGTALAQSQNQGNPGTPDQNATLGSQLGVTTSQVPQGPPSQQPPSLNGTTDQGNALPNSNSGGAH